MSVNSSAPDAVQDQLEIAWESGRGIGTIWPLLARFGTGVGGAPQLALENFTKSLPFLSRFLAISHLGKPAKERE